MINSNNLWKRPLKTFIYFVYELQYQINCYVPYLKEHFKAALPVSVFSLIFLFIVFGNIPGKPNFLYNLQNFIELSLFWIGLGILSSVGLGSGLHTFILYLGPHIARVTLAAYECGSLDFPEPPYPNKILCPLRNRHFNQKLLNYSINGVHARKHLSMYAILSKVRIEAFMWGLGTAIGELPPYFMARFARLSRDSCMKVSLSDNSPSSVLKSDEDSHDCSVIQSYFNKAEYFIRLVVSRIGFWGILVCASIPNPLFDIAGLTCGHFLVPFWTFFGATFIGKAIIKMHLQVLAVIALFSKDHMKTLTEFSSRMPIIGAKLHNLLLEYMNSQLSQLHSSQSVSTNQSWLQVIFDWIVVAMILYFVISIINSMSHQYRSRKRIRSESLIL